MKNAVYQVKTENGHESVWTFEEVHNDGDYGNGNYIVVFRGENDIMAYLDVRYQKYVFETVCENYIKQYYGENLYSFKRVGI